MPLALIDDFKHLSIKDEVKVTTKTPPPTILVTATTSSSSSALESKEIKQTVDENHLISLIAKKDDTTNGTTNEGVHSDCSPRLPTIRMVESKFPAARGVILIRAPPASGKTTFCKLYELYHTAMGTTVYHVSLVAKLRDKSLSAWFKSKCGEKNFDEILDNKSGTRTILIVDEIQKAYETTDDHTTQEFWSCIKGFVQEPSPNLTVLLVGAYGEPRSVSHQYGTPYAFHANQIIDPKEFRFTREEFDYVVTKHNLRPREFGIKLPASVVNMVWASTAGHPGLVYDILWLMRRLGGKEDTPIDPVPIMKWMMGTQFGIQMENCRALPSHHVFPAEQKDLIIRVLHNNYVEAETDTDVKVATDLIRAGILIHNGHKYVFTCPLIRRLMHVKVHEVPVDVVAPTSFEDFVFALIGGIRSSSLKTTHSISERNTVLEYHFQSELYRVARQLLPASIGVTPEVSKILNDSRKKVMRRSNGRLDLYINGTLNWGLELVRDGIRLQQHIDRFQSGDYGTLGLKRWAIIDFRKKAPKKKIADTNLWYVIYSVPDYLTATVIHNGMTRSITFPP